MTIVKMALPGTAKVINTKHYKQLVVLVGLRNISWVAQELNFFCQSISTLFIVLDIYNVWHSMTAENMYMNTTRIVVISYDTYLLVVDIYVKNNFF